VRSDLEILFAGRAPADDPRWLDLAVKASELASLWKRLDALRAAAVERMMRDARVAKLSPFETCATPDPDDWEHIATMDRVRFHVRVGGETKDLVVRRELGRFQVLRFDLVPEAKPAVKKKPASTSAKKPQAAQK